MTELEKPTFILDLKDSFNRARLEGAEPGIQFKVSVVTEQNRNAKPNTAIGCLSKDKKIFLVSVKTSEGTQEHQWNWENLKDALASYRN